ncbi:hypothetical protein Tco_0753928 [Tanacetum coccineum]
MLISVKRWVILLGNVTVEVVGILKQDHKGEDEEKDAAQVYGMIDGDDDDAVGDASGDVSDAAAEFALMGLSSQEHSCLLPTKPDLMLPQVYLCDKSLDSETTGFASCVSSVKSLNSKTNDHLASASSSVNFKTVSKTADQKPSSTIDDPLGLYNKPMWHNVANIPSFVPRAAYVPAGSRNPPASVSVGLAVITNCTWMREDGELLLRPQQVVLGKLKGHICSGDPRTMVDLINLHGLTLKNESTRKDNPHKNKDLGIVDSGCSRSMTGNKEKLDDFVKIIGGTVTFGGGDGKITGKCTIRTSKLNFENVYYVEELQNFNLFFVSQICDKKNKVLFTDKECLVLTKEFQLPENSQVVLRVPRRHNLYSFNLTKIQPERDINCLLAKASSDESTKWHRRKAHVNFKNIMLASIY